MTINASEWSNFIRFNYIKKDVAVKELQNLLGNLFGLCSFPALFFPSTIHFIFRQQCLMVFSDRMTNSSRHHWTNHPSSFSCPVACLQLAISYTEQYVNHNNTAGMWFFQWSNRKYAAAQKSWDKNECHYLHRVVPSVIWTHVCPNIWTCVRIFWQNQVLDRSE